MNLFEIALAVYLVSGIAALLANSSPRWASRLGAGGAVLGSVLGLIPAIQVLSGTKLATVQLPWSVPGGSLSIAIDPLSAFFLVPIFVIGAATAIYGAEYLAPEAEHKQLGPPWLWFNLLTGSMALVATAANGLLFLVSWEAMALTSFFLVIFHHEKPGVSRAGWIYLAATHIGTAFLLALFAWLASDAGSLDFAEWRRPETGAVWVFVLAIVGFGSKAGLFPFHVWLPEAHPVAPSHASALLSGVMVKLGIYGILRILIVLGEPEASWGVLLLTAGLASGIYGAMVVIGQRDLKRLLAYSTVENIGIVALGLGLGVLAASVGEFSIAALAMAGGLIHVWNHAIFKTLLFLSAGSVAHGSNTLDIERLGGLLKRMPWTGTGFLVGGAAICALPPFNGFVGEFLIYLTSFHAISTGSSIFVPALLSIAGLSVIGALAAAGFVRASGIALLGEPRSEDAAQAHEVAWPMNAVLVALCVGCLMLGVAGPIGLLAAMGPIEQLMTPAGDFSAIRESLQEVVPLLWKVGAGGAALALLTLGVLWLRGRLPRAVQRDVGTWDCGYAAPTARMQYTASSFSEPLTRLLATVLGLRSSGRPPSGANPREESFATTTSDFAESGYARIFAGIAALARRLQPLQTGNTQQYVLYTTLAALGILLWSLA